MARLPQSRIFVGYSSVDTSIKKTQYADLDLIKRDLINIFYTRRGERVMRPDFGSIIWDILFEPMTDDNIAIIVDDCRRIIESDARVSLNDIKVVQYDNGLQVQLDLYYPAFDIAEQFKIDFDRRSVESAAL
jgi:phage baseplate assembly protein W